jgi:hypothetical protein
MSCGESKNSTKNRDRRRTRRSISTVLMTREAWCYVRRFKVGLGALLNAPHHARDRRYEAIINATFISPFLTMPPRRRPQFTQESVEQQLQQIHLLDQSSSSENLEQLSPIIKQIHTNRQQEAYLRTLQGLIESKDAEIETICRDNYQDFISSVSTLFTVKSYTHNLRDKISSLDSSVSQIGRGLAEKKRALLQSKKTATNLDEAIDSLQASLRILDVVDRVGDMIKEGKYWSALRVGDRLALMPGYMP